MRYRDMIFGIVAVALAIFLIVVAFRGGNIIFDNIERDQDRQDRVENCVYMLEGRTGSDKIRSECERMYQR